MWGMSCEEKLRKIFTLHVNQFMGRGKWNKKSPK